MPQIAGLGHVGIYAEDLMKMRDFYSRVMGLKIADEDLEQRGMVFMSSDPVSEHHEFVLMQGRVTRDDAKVIQQISFKVPEIQDMREYRRRLLDENIQIERIVSHGNAFGMYFFDPEFVLSSRVTRDDAKVIQQISFKVPEIQDMREYRRRLLDENIQIERIVSHGNAFGMYFFDPEGNRIELYYRTGLPVPQPHGDLIDLERSDEELMADARELLVTKL